MRLNAEFAPLVLIMTAGPFLQSLPKPQQTDAACNVTIPNARDSVYGNPKLSVFLWPTGIIVFKPGGPGFVTSDGALGMKFGWTRGVPGKLNVTGHRLDGAAGPVRLETNDGYGDIGFQASYLIFPTPGCWEVTAQVDDRGDSKITFVTSIVKIGEGPTWRRDP